VQIQGAEDPLQKLGLTRRADFLLAADVGGRRLVDSQMCLPRILGFFAFLDAWQVVYASAKEALNKQLLHTMLKLTHADSVIWINSCHN